MFARRPKRMWVCWITVEVLVKNRAAYEFWKAIGFQDYAIMLEMLRDGDPT